MNKQFFRLPESMTPQARNAVLISAFLAVLFGAMLIYFLTREQLVDYFFMGSIAITMLIAMLSTWFSYKGYVQPGMLALIVAMLAVPITYQFRGTGDSLFNAILTLITVVGIAMPTLTGKWLGRAVLAGGAGAALVLLIDLFGPAGRKQYTLQATDYAIMVVLVGVFLYLALRGFRDYNLTTKLVSAFLAVSIIPTVGLSYYNNLIVHQDLTNAANAALSGAAVETAESLDGFITDNLNLARITAELHIMQEYMALPVNERPSSETETVLYVDLRAIASRDPAYITSVSLMDARGRIVADTAQNEIGEDNSDLTYFTQPRDTGQPYVSPVVIDDEEFSLIFSAPVHDPNGKIFGVVRIRYSAAILQQLLTAASDNLGIEGTVMDLFDENHIFLAITDAPEEAFRTVMPLPADKLAQLQAEGRLLEGSAESLSLNQPDLEQALYDAGQIPAFTLESEGEQAAVAPLTNQPWVILAAQPQDIYLAPIGAQTRTGLVITLIVAGLVSAMAFFFSQFLSRPILQLTNVAQQIAGGDFNVQAPVTSADEIGALAGAFNQMSRQIQQTLQVLQRRAAELATVAKVSTDATQTTDTNALLQQVVDQTKAAFNLYHAHVYLLNQTGDTLELVNGAGEVGKQMVSEKRTIPMDREQSLVARAARTRQGVIVNDVRADAGFLPHPLLPETRSEMAVPMIVGDKVLGVIDVQADTVDRFSEEDANIQTTLAAQIATALQNTRQYAETQRRASELEVVANVSTAASTITKADQLLQEVVDLSKQSFGLYHAHIYLLNETGDTLELASGAGEIGRQMVAEGRQIPLNREQSLVARAARDRVGFFVNNVRVDPDFLPNPLLPETRSELAVPLIVADRVLGVLDVQADTTNHFTDNDIRIQTTLAGQVAVALQNARAFSQAQKQAERESKLNAINQKIQSATSVEAVLQIAARELGRALDAPLTVAQLGIRENGNGANN